MILKRFYDEFLAQASFLVGCERTREAVVIDPNRNIRTYTDAAEDSRLRIAAVAETHIHADFLSGASDLAENQNAQLCLSGMGGNAWTYAPRIDLKVRTLQDGDVISVGTLRLQVLHTPGHTPEHIVFLVTDTTVSSEVLGAFTGDFIFAGDVGRPDLLEKAAGVAGTMRQGAEQLYESIQRFSELPDYLQLWPGHGAGSACGKALGAIPQTTLGYEKIANWAFNTKGKDEFVATVLEGQPDPPLYFAVMKRMNRDGAPKRPVRGLLPELSDSKIRELAASGEVVVDTRNTDAFAKGFLPGSINVPLNKSFANWAGSVIPYGRDVYLIVEAPEESKLAEVVAVLQLIGLDRVMGYASTGALERIAASGESFSFMPQLTVNDLANAMDLQILDVRTSSEHAEGHIAGSKSLALQSLASTFEQLDPARPIAVHCAGGTRSAIAASLLASHGFRDVANVTGGFGAWAKAGLPVEKT
ncbi:MAG: MBL fold metallo-hydrolase [Gemmatimonadaceae bacterium]|nr:MBL fold metallo-hydrolase [Gemmatimonadaceae bacterium]